MVDHPDMPSLRVGTAIFGFELPHPWADGVDYGVIEHRLSDASMLIAFLSGRRISFALFSDGPEEIEGDKSYRAHKMTDKFVAPPIEEGLQSVVCNVAWKDSKFCTVRLNGFQCLGEPGAAPDSIGPGDLALRPPVDFGVENETARTMRRSRLKGWQGLPMRMPGGLQYAMSALRDEVSQIEELLGFVRAGKEHHALGLASRLRLLLYGKPMGLLQICAAHEDLPLTLFTVNDPDELPPGKDGFWLSISGSVKAHGPHQNPIDMDVWLGKFAFRADGRDYTNLEIIKEIGNSVGSHRDIDIKPVLAALMNTPGMARRYHNVTLAVIAYADIALSLGSFVLRQAEAAPPA